MKYSAIVKQVYNCLKKFIPRKIKHYIMQTFHHFVAVFNNLQYKFLYTQWLKLIDKKIGSEKNLFPHSREEKAELFHSFNMGSTEIEILNFLNAAIFLFKPDLVLETGTYGAAGTIAIAHALKKNKRGKLFSIEQNKAYVEYARRVLQQKKLDSYVEIINSDTLAFIKSLSSDYKFDFVFFDSENLLRPKEFSQLYKKGCLTDIVSFHDTSRSCNDFPPYEEQKIYISQLDEIQEKYCIGGIELSLSRGFRMMQLRKDINPAFTNLVV